jgi:hypothetical protein
MKPISDDLMKSKFKAVAQIIKILMQIIYKYFNFIAYLLIREVQFYKKTHRTNIITLRKKDDFNLKSAFVTL